MARPNQAYYNQLIKRYNLIEFENEILNTENKLDSIEDIETLWNCLEDCENLYNRSVSLIDKFGDLQKSQKFEMEETVIEYNKKIRSLENIKLDTISTYKTCKSAFGSQFSDAELQRIKEFAIDRENL